MRRLERVPRVDRFHRARQRGGAQVALTALRCGAAAVLLLAAGVPCARADVETDRRLRAGARIFRAVLAADEDLPSRAGPDGRLLLVVFHEEDLAEAERNARLLATGVDGSVATIREMPLRVEATSDPTFAAFLDPAPAGIFVAGPAREETLRMLVQHGIHRRMIVFSPMEGHVEKGVVAGISVEDKVAPYLNRRTLEASSVHLKPFLLKVAKAVD